MLKIPFFRLGTWKHPKYGPIIGTQEMFDAMKANFRNQALGRDPFIRIGHDQEGKTTFGDAPAEGWVKDLVQEGDVLYAVANPTNQEVVDAVRDKRYRFASAEYTPNYFNKETGQSVGPVLSAVSLTNEPFLTRLPEAMVLSDPPETIYMDYEEVETMTFDPKTLNDKLDENTSWLKKLSEGFTEFFKGFGKPADPPATPPAAGELPDDVKAKLAEAENLKKKLAEQSETDRKTKLADLKTSIDTRANDLVKKGVFPAMVDKAKEMLLAAVAGVETVKLADNGGEMMGPNGRCECAYCGNMPLCGNRGYMPLTATQDLADKTFAMLEALPEESRVKFGQTGSSESKPPGGTDAIQLAEDIKFLNGKVREDGRFQF